MRGIMAAMMKSAMDRESLERLGFEEFHPFLTMDPMAPPLDFGARVVLRPSSEEPNFLLRAEADDSRGRIEPCRRLTLSLETGFRIPRCSISEAQA